MEQGKLSVLENQIEEVSEESQIIDKLKQQIKYKDGKIKEYELLTTSMLPYVFKFFLLNRDTCTSELTWMFNSELIPYLELVFLEITKEKSLVQNVRRLVIEID